MSNGQSRKSVPIERFSASSAGAVGAAKRPPQSLWESAVICVRYSGGDADVGPGFHPLRATRSTAGRVGAAVPSQASSICLFAIIKAKRNKPNTLGLGGLVQSVQPRRRNETQLHLT